MPAPFRIASRALYGSETLAYSRARKTEGGDFDRAQRQQQVVMAVRDKIFELDSMPTRGLGRLRILHRRSNGSCASWLAPHLPKRARSHNQQNPNPSCRNDGRSAY